VPDGVDAAVLRLQRAGDVGKVLGLGDREIERQYRRLRMPGGEDPVVQRLQLAHHPAMQHYRGALRGTTHGENRAQPAARAGDQYHPTFEPFMRLRCGIRQRSGDDARRLSMIADNARRDRNAGPGMMSLRASQTLRTFAKGRSGSYNSRLAVGL
jgi:hypothetical protein